MFRWPAPLNPQDKEIGAGDNARTPLCRELPLFSFPHQNASAAKRDEKIFSAIEAGDVKSLEYVLDNGGDPDTVFVVDTLLKSRWSALHQSCQKGDYECTKLLIKKGNIPLHLLCPKHNGPCKLQICLFFLSASCLLRKTRMHFFFHCENRYEKADLVCAGMTALRCHPQLCNPVRIHCEHKFTLKTGIRTVSFRISARKYIFCFWTNSCGWIAPQNMPPTLPKKRNWPFFLSSLAWVLPLIAETRQKKGWLFGNPQKRTQVSFYLSFSWYSCVHPTGACLEIPDGLGQTALYYCICCEWLELMELLIKSGCNIEAYDNRHMAPLHRAVNCTTTAPLEILLKCVSLSE